MLFSKPNRYQVLSSSTSTSNSSTAAAATTTDENNGLDEREINQKDEGEEGAPLIQEAADIESDVSVDSSGSYPSNAMVERRKKKNNGAPSLAATTTLISNSSTMMMPPGGSSSTSNNGNNSTGTAVTSSSDPTPIVASLDIENGGGIDETNEKKKDGPYDYPKRTLGRYTISRSIPEPPCVKRKVGRMYVCFERPRQNGGTRLICMMGPCRLFSRYSLNKSIFSYHCNK
jgi:hypothetical protein